jgi:hypothetical protein
MTYGFTPAGMSADSRVRTFMPGEIKSGKLIANQSSKIGEVVALRRMLRASGSDAGAGTRSRRLTECPNAGAKSEAICPNRPVPLALLC